MTKKFIYNIENSDLYGPDGSFIKKVFCPKAVDFNQLIVNEGDKEFRSCLSCGDKLLDLDAVDVDEAIRILSEDETICVCARNDSHNVTFLQPSTRLPFLKDFKKPTQSDLPLIRVATNLEHINRAVNLGYKPVIRVLPAPYSDFNEVCFVYRNKQTGFFEIFHEHPDRLEYLNLELVASGQKNPLVDVLVWAYLIPKDLKDGSLVLLDVVIEDVATEVAFSIGSESIERASRARAHYLNEDIILNFKANRKTYLIG